MFDEFPEETKLNNMDLTYLINLLDIEKRKDANKEWTQAYIEKRHMLSFNDLLTFKFLSTISGKLCYLRDKLPQIEYLEKK